MLVTGESMLKFLRLDPRSICSTLRPRANHDVANIMIIGLFDSECDSARNSLGEIAISFIWAEI